jgi:hypothetical protein
VSLNHGFSLTNSVEYLHVLLHDLQLFILPLVVLDSGQVGPCLKVKFVTFQFVFVRIVLVNCSSIEYSNFANGRLAHLGNETVLSSYEFLLSSSRFEPLSESNAFYFVQ